MIYDLNMLKTSEVYLFNEIFEFISDLQISKWI